MQSLGCARCLNRIAALERQCRHAPGTVSRAPSSHTQQRQLQAHAVMAKDSLQESSKDGAFKRTASTFRSHISQDGDFKPAAGRYILYISYACPWANGALAVRNLKGLQDVIELSVTHPTWQRTRPDQDEHSGWAFASPGDKPFANPLGYGSFPPKDVIPDPVNNATFVRDLYEMTGNDPGKYTVPVLWDKEKKTIVNNESMDIIGILNSEFEDLAKNASLDLCPADMKDKLDELNSWIYPNINNGVYRAGFAQKQEPYEEAFHDVFNALDKAEGILSKSRYIAGDKLTYMDIRLFMTLIRFDPVYVVYFKCNKQFIHEYPNLREYTKEMYGMLKDCIDIWHIKTHYFTSHPKLNAYAVVPVGCDAWWEEPHNRDETHPVSSKP